MQNNNKHKHTVDDDIIVIDTSNDKWDLFFFLIILGIVLVLLFPGYKDVFQKPVSCETHNSNYSACVEAQRTGAGCAWYASCQKCGKYGSDTSKVCN